MMITSTTSLICPSNLLLPYLNPKPVIYLNTVCKMTELISIKRLLTMIIFLIRLVGGFP